jgi:hypothetical protein
LPNQCSSRHRLPQRHSKSISRPIRSAVEGGWKRGGSKKIGVIAEVQAETDPVAELPAALLRQRPARAVAPRPGYRPSDVRIGLPFG